ncbi:MAG: hypothetical protein ACRD3V_04300 [Vicinamibacteria bacterium]
MTRRLIVGSAIIVLGTVVAGTYVQTRPTKHYFEHLDVVGQNRDPLIKDPIDLAQSPEAVFFVLERDGRVLSFEKAAPYRGTEIARIERAKALAYDETTDSLLVLGESGHAVFRVNYREKTPVRLYGLQEHYFGHRSGIAADPDGHLLVNNAKVPTEAPILALAADGTIYDGFGTRELDADANVETLINVMRLRFTPFLLALGIYTGDLTYFSGSSVTTARLPRAKQWKPRRTSANQISASPLLWDVAPILDGQIFVLAPVRPRVFGYILDQSLQRTGEVRLSKRTPDWVATQLYHSVCQLTYDTYALASRSRLDVYRVY